MLRGISIYTHTHTHHGRTELTLLQYICSGFKEACVLAGKSYGRIDLMHTFCFPYPLMLSLFSCQVSLKMLEVFNITIFSEVLILHELGTWLAQAL